MARFDQFSEEMVRGDTHKLEVTMVNDATGDPINITNHADFRFTATATLGEASPLIDVTEPANITVTDAANGVLLVTLLPANTNSLENRRYALFAELRAQNSAGEIDRTQGTLIIKPRVRGTA